MLKRPFLSDTGETLALCVHWSGLLGERGEVDIMGSEDGHVKGIHH